MQKNQMNAVKAQKNSIIKGKTGDYTILPNTEDLGATFHNSGMTAAITFSLPAATVGQKYSFKVEAAQELRVDPNGTETIALPSTGAQSAAGKYITADAIGESVDIECIVAGDWNVNNYIGTWAAQT